MTRKKSISWLLVVMLFVSMFAGIQLISPLSAYAAVSGSLPTGWSFMEIGDAQGALADYSYDSVMQKNVLKLSAAGGIITSGTASTLEPGSETGLFAYTGVATGDTFELTAKLSDFADYSGGTLASKNVLLIMARDSGTHSETTAPFDAIRYKPTDSSKKISQYRRVSGAYAGASSAGAVTSINNPAYPNNSINFKITRDSSGVITTYYNTSDNAAWTSFGSNYTDTKAMNVGFEILQSTAAITDIRFTKNGNTVFDSNASESLNAPIVTATPGDSMATLEWQSVTGATYYKVGISSANSGPYTVLPDQVENTSYIYNNLQNGTMYYFTVAAYNETQAGPLSDPVSVTPFAKLPAPTGLTATAGDTQAKLTWKTVSGAAYYRIYGGTSGETGMVGQTDAGASDFTLTGLTNGLTYTYAVSACSDTQESNKTDPVSIIPVISSPVITVLASEGAIAVTLQSVTGAVCYTVKIGTEEGVYTDSVKIDSSSETSYKCMFSELKNGQKYYITAIASDALSDSAVTVKTATPSVPVVSGELPDGWYAADINLPSGAKGGSVNFDPATGRFSITGSGTGIESSNTSDSFYYVYMKASNAASITARVTLDSKSSIAENSKVGLMMRESLAPGANMAFSSLTNNKNGLQGIYRVAENAKSSSGSKVNDQSQAYLTLNKIINSSMFKIYGSYLLADGSSATLFGNKYPAGIGYAASDTYIGIAVPTGCTAYVDYVEVRAETSSTVSPAVTLVFDSMENAVDVPIPAPSSITAEAGDGNAFLLWSPLKKAVSYIIKTSDSLNGTYTWGMNVDKGNSATISGLTNGKTYYYEVCGVDAQGKEGYISKPVSVIPYIDKNPPAKPATPNILPGNRCVTVSWKSVPKAQNYIVYMNDAEVFRTSDKYTTLYTKTGLENGKAYEFSVKAVNNNGESAASDIVAATPSADIGGSFGSTTEECIQVDPMDIPEDSVVSDYSQLKAKLAQLEAENGGTVYIKAERITCNSQLVLGKFNSNIRIENYPGYAPILDFALIRQMRGDTAAGIKISGSYYYLKGLIIEKAGDNGLQLKPDAAFTTGTASNNTIENCVTRYNGDSGVQVSGNASYMDARPSNNTFINVYSYRNCNMDIDFGGNADGFAVKLFPGKGNKFIGCFAWENSDDGWDLFDNNEDVTWENCVTWHNGDRQVFTGEYDFYNGNPLDDNLILVQLFKQDPLFIQNLANGRYIIPDYTVVSLGGNLPDKILRDLSWGGNPNGFKLGSNNSLNTVRVLKNCIAFDNDGNGYDKNSSAGSGEIINGVSFDNNRNYSLTGYVFNTFSNNKGFGSIYADTLPSGAAVITPDIAEQNRIRDEVLIRTSYIAEKAFSDKIPVKAGFSFYPTDSENEPVRPSRPDKPVVTLSFPDATISWNSVSDAVYYKVFCSDTITGNYHEIYRTADSNTTHYVNKNLESNHDYYYTVTAVNESAESYKSEATLLTTPSVSGGAAPIFPATSNSISIYPTAGGTVALGSEAKVVIPSGALTGNTTLVVMVEKVTQTPVVPAQDELLSKVYSFTVGGKNNYNFASKITITLSFDPTLIKGEKKPSIYYYDEAASKWVELGGKVSGSTIAVEVDHFTKFAVFASSGDNKVQPALNDISGHWAQSYIERLISAGAVSGYPDGSFKPDENITRAEFVTMLVKAFKLDIKSGKVFNDTDKHWAKDYISTAALSGIVKGYENGDFGADDNITREQMTAMIINAAKISASGEPSFKDKSSVSDWAKSAVAAAVKNGIIKGYEDNTFRPQANATRAEAVTIIVNAMDIK